MRNLWLMPVMAIGLLGCHSKSNEEINFQRTESERRTWDLHQKVMSLPAGFDPSDVDSVFAISDTLNCSRHTSNGATHIGFQLSDMTETGLPVSFRLNLQSVVQNGDNRHPTIRNAIRWSIFYGLDEIFAFSKLTASGKSTHASIKWGPFIRGASFASFDIDQDAIKGVIDDREFNVTLDGNGSGWFNFTDGGQAPKVDPTPGLQKLLDGFTPVLMDAVKTCLENVTEVLDQHSAISLDRLDRVQDHGHISDTRGVQSCYNCIGFVEALQVVADIGCAAAGFLTFGIGAAACLAGAALAAAAGETACIFGTCCPQQCGPSSWPLNPPPCCFGDEWCLNHDGFCCNQNQTPCLGQACCNPDQSCITVGPSKGTCCPDSAVCGNSCCSGDTDRCLDNSICCHPRDVCGHSCCGDTTGGPSLVQYHCANAQTGLCCPVGQVDVDGFGHCCDPGQHFLDGICCAPDRKNCGDNECCPGECKEGKCVWAKTDEDCMAEGLGDESCALHYPSYYCEFCRDGCCYYIH